MKVSGRHEHRDDASTSSRTHDCVVTIEKGESREGDTATDSYRVARDIFRGFVTKSNLLPMQHGTGIVK